MWSKSDFPHHYFLHLLPQEQKASEGNCGRSRSSSFLILLVQPFSMDTIFKTNLEICIFPSARGAQKRLTEVACETFSFKKSVTDTFPRTSLLDVYIDAIHTRASKIL